MHAVDAKHMWTTVKENKRIEKTKEKSMSSGAMTGASSKEAAREICVVCKIVGHMHQLRCEWYYRYSHA